MEKYIPIAKFIKTSSAPYWFIFHNLTHELMNEEISICFPAKHSCQYNRKDTISGGLKI